MNSSTSSMSLFSSFCILTAVIPLCQQHQSYSVLALCIQLTSHEKRCGMLLMYTSNDWRSCLGLQSVWMKAFGRLIWILEPKWRWSCVLTVHASQFNGVMQHSQIQNATCCTCCLRACIIHLLQSESLQHITTHAAGAMVSSDALTQVAVVLPVVAPCHPTGYPLHQSPYFHLDPCHFRMAGKQLHASRADQSCSERMQHCLHLSGKAISRT